jgi:hypothetical protein
MANPRDRATASRIFARNDIPSAIANVNARAEQFRRPVPAVQMQA